MNPVVALVYNEISTMAVSVTGMGIQRETPFNTMWNWQQPAMSVEDLEFRLQQAQSSLSKLPDVLPELTLAAMQRLHVQTSFFRSNVLPNLPGTNSMFVVPPLLEMLDRIEDAVGAIVSPYPPPPPPPPFPDWQKLASDGYLPKKLAVRLKGMEERLEQLAPRADELSNKLSAIDDAYDSAENLPESLSTLEDGKRAVNSARTEAQSRAAEAAISAREASTLLDEIKSLAKQSAEKFEDLTDAHRAAATRGLASSFQKRANDLGWSVRLWVLVLVCDLAAGAAIGYFRFEELQKVLSSPQPAAVVWGNLVFSLLSVAAPVWLGWVATKQINQRFKLAEDYGFKATVASAYEAWKSEAQKQDAEFQKRLFGSALSRLEEAPLRFVEAENYGSPWHELTSSAAFSNALQKFPDLKAVVAQIVATAGGSAAGAGAVLGLLKGSTKGPNSSAADLAPTPPTGSEGSQ